MPLLCGCWSEGDECEWYSTAPDDYSVMPEFKRRKRCSSCNSLIDNGSVVTKFERSRYARGDIEEAIYGEGGDVPLAPMYLCEECSDLYFNLEELGYQCIAPDENMRELVAEYAAIAAGK